MNQEEQKTKDDSRREFLMKVALGMGGLAAVTVAVPVVGALLAPLLEDQPQVWRNVGTPDDFPVGSTKLVKFDNADPKTWAGSTAHTAAWIRRDSESTLTAFSVHCTHLGCPVRWEADAQLFMCPCHGGVYYRDGTVAAGPPPKSLPQHPIRVAHGQVQIGTQPMPITNFSDNASNENPA